jgi:hypothetical protein
VKVTDLPLAKGSKILLFTVPESGAVSASLDARRNKLNELIKNDTRENVFVPLSHLHFPIPYPLSHPSPFIFPHSHPTSKIMDGFADNKPQKKLHIRSLGKDKVPRHASRRTGLHLGRRPAFHRAGL